MTTLTANRCLCRGCGLVFRSPSAFDKHRVGPTSSRRCLAPSEMLAAGMVVNAHGVWVGAAYSGPHGATPDIGERTGEEVER